MKNCLAELTGTDRLHNHIEMPRANFELPRANSKLPRLFELPCADPELNCDLILIRRLRKALRWVKA